MYGQASPYCPVGERAGQRHHEDCKDLASTLPPVIGGRTQLQPSQPQLPAFGQSRELSDYADKTKVWVRGPCIRWMDQQGGTHNRSHDAWER